MDALIHFFQNLWAVHANGFISIWVFFTNNISMLLILACMVFMAIHEVRDSADLFASDNRKIM